MHESPPCRANRDQGGGHQGLVFCGFFGVVDDEHLHRFSVRLQFQAELILKRSQERRAVRISGRFGCNQFTRLL